MATNPSTYLTPEQYLEIERRAERKSEYYNGEMFAMAGGIAFRRNCSIDPLFPCPRVPCLFTA